MRFHRRCGDRVTLLHDNSTAVRNFVEFNHGLILSCVPLKDDVMFEVRIDRKVNVWNGSLEIGVTTLDPDNVELPATATKLRNTAWIMSGSSIVKDGITLINSYGPELDTLREGDCLGVMRTSKKELMFYVNGHCLGIAEKDMPPRLFAVIDLYGQCVQVSITRTHEIRPVMETILDQIEEDPNNDETLTSSDMEVAGLPTTSYPNEIRNVYIPMVSDGACALVQDCLRFHPRCGILVKLSANNKSAERARPLDDYNNGVVMTHRPLYDNELFEIRIDMLVDKWSGSIEVGVTSHNPDTIRFPSTMTNMASGTVMMSGCKVLLNGYGTCLEYGNFNLDDLREGDTVGMMKKSNGELHYFINGIDQGIATDKVDQQVWGVVDLYGMTVKVTVVDSSEDISTNAHHPSLLMLASPESPAPCRFRPRIDEDSLLFHTLRDSNVVIINDGKTAHRLNAFKYFNNGIVMTHRPLRINELFQVRIDLIVPKWAGSIEIGVTQHTFYDIQLPFKMSNSKSGTWAVTGEDVIRDGVIIIPQYMRNLNKLVEGETVGIMRNDLGILHIFINGTDQGPAAFNLPENIYGIVDLYGRAAQVTIVDNYTPPPLYSPESPLSTESNATIFPEMCFHRVHGRNARLSRNRLSAWRATVYSEFNDSVLFSSRPLRECDMFELRIDNMVDCWIGSIEIGVTAIRPDDFEASGGVGAIAGTATDLNWDTYILSGAAMMKDGECVRSGYPLDLDTLSVGSRVGMMWHADRSIHYYLDGMDMGKAWYVPHLNIYAVVDLYGQCTQVTILQNEERAFNYNGCTNSDNSGLMFSSPPPPYWSFSEYCGDNVCLMHEYSIAQRLTPDPLAALVFSSSHLEVGELFEIKISACRFSYAGSFRMGVTDINILNAHVNRSLPPSISCLPHFTAYIDGKFIKYSQPGTRAQEFRSFVPSLEWLRPGDRVGLKKTNESTIVIYYNTELMGVTFENVPDKVYVVMELYGRVTRIHAMNLGHPVVTPGLLLHQSIPNTGYTKSNLFQRNNVYNDNIDGLFDPNFASLANICVNSGESTDGSLDGLVAEHSVEPSGRLSIEAIEEILNGDPVLELPPDPSLSASPVQNDKSTAPPSIPPDSPPNTDLPDDLSENVANENENPNKSSKDCEGADVETKKPECESSETMLGVRRRRNLPYTFYYVHGDNIRLTSSDTVAVRFKGYNQAIAVVSQPLRRGHNFRFRVDKLDSEWCGTASIGAVGILPLELPMSSIHLDPPCWVLTSDILNDNGVSTISEMGLALDALIEQSVLALHFRFNSELVLEIDGKIIGSMGVVPRRYSHVFPTIDLYGKIVQVSVLLHPYAITSGTSLDLPIINEQVGEDNFADEEELQIDQESENVVDTSPATKKPDAYSQDSLIERRPPPLVVEPGPSTEPDPIPETYNTVTETKNKEVKCREAYPQRTSLHHSLILSDNSRLANNNETVNRCIQKSHSTHSFSQTSEANEGREPRPSFSDGAYAIGGLTVTNQPFCDTNIEHDHRYPEAYERNNRYAEAIDVDNLDIIIMNGLTMEQCNLPDLTEEQSSSTSRRVDYFSESLTVENFNYLNRVLCLDQEGIEGQNLESEWEASGEGCEHLHLVLKYWNELVGPYPELRQAVSWGQVRCYCSNCQPSEASPLAGWVRIERIDGVGAAQRAFWHVGHYTLRMAQAQIARGERGQVRRPQLLTEILSTSPPTSDIWIDEEGKPHHTVLAIEIDIEGTAVEHDRLLAFLIYLKPHHSFIDYGDDVD